MSMCAKGCVKRDFPSSRLRRTRESDPRDSGQLRRKCVFTPSVVVGLLLGFSAGQVACPLTLNDRRYNSALDAYRSRLMALSVAKGSLAPRVTTTGLSGIGLGNAVRFVGQFVYRVSYSKLILLFSVT
jgi:hypothetical protein